MPTIHKKRPLLFLSVGVFNTIVDFCVYTLLTTFLFKSVDQIAIAGVASGTFALIGAFVTHAYITWRGTNVGWQTVLRFGLFTGFGMWVMRPVFLAIFIQFGDLYSWVHGISVKLSLSFGYPFIANTGAFCLTLVIVLSYNYYVYSKYVFNDRTEPENR